MTNFIEEHVKQLVLLEKKYKDLFKQLENTRLAIKKCEFEIAHTVDYGMEIGKQYLVKVSGLTLKVKKKSDTVYYVDVIE